MILWIHKHLYLNYFQGWINDIIHDKDKRNSTWRLNPEVSGISSCLADIGTHAFNMLELVCGMKVKKILADLKMDPKARAESLTIKEFCLLANHIKVS